MFPVVRPAPKDAPPSLSFLRPVSPPGKAYGGGGGVHPAACGPHATQGAVDAEQHTVINLLQIL